MLFVYRVLINIITIISPLIFFFRILKKKEHPLRFKEKLCFFSKKRNKGKLIWFHGASVGEILSVIPLIERLEKNKKISQILVTSNTLSSSKIILNLKLKKTSHQFFPIDTTYHTKKFLDYWKPSTAIFIDSEIWPNMIMSIKKRPISLILLNARITKKSFKKWKLFSSSAKIFFEKFDFCLSSSFQSNKYLKLLGARKTEYIGNLKFSQTEKKDDFLDAKLQKFFLSKKIWCAASTHESEEKFCALAHKKLKKKYKNFLTIIIPRHVHRSNNIIKEMEKLNLNVHVHTSKNQIKNDTDVYLVNSYGKTKSFFKICKIVFLGGSIIKHGGQNPLEAARYGCKILYGPNVWNFNEIYNLLNQYKVSHKVHNFNQTIYNIEKIFKNKMSSENVKNKITKLGNKILNKTLKKINTFINKNEIKKT
jgi:3-deoxy-D-manno-octulosonic-acid transferase